jgi:hypothetical protein
MQICGKCHGGIIEEEGETVRWKWINRICDCGNNLIPESPPMPLISAYKAPPIDDLEIYRAAVAIFVSIYQSSASVDLLRAEAIEQARQLAKEVKGE